MQPFQRPATGGHLPFALAQVPMRELTQLREFHRGHPHRRRGCESVIGLPSDVPLKEMRELRIFQPPTPEEVLARIMRRLADAPTSANPVVTNEEAKTTNPYLSLGIAKVLVAPLVRCADCRHVRYKSRRKYHWRDGNQWEEWLVCRHGHEVTLLELSEPRRYCTRFTPRSSLADQKRIARTLAPGA
jgi:hypothetical protein